MSSPDENESPMSEENKDYTYFINNKSSSYEETKDLEYVVAINDENEKNVLRFFENNDDFMNWCQSSRYADDFNKKWEEIKLQQKNETDDSFVKTESEKVSKDIESIKVEISKLSEELKLPVSSMDLINQVRDRGIMKSLILYEGFHFSGNWVPIVLPFFGMPDLRWVRFDNRASSVRSWVFHILSNDYWWRGPAMVLAGFVYLPRLPRAFIRQVSSIF